MRKDLRRLCLVAVDIRSAHNVGSLFRSCDGFGAELWLVGITPRPAQNHDDRLPHVVKKSHDAITKTALGAERNVSWRYIKSFSDCIALLNSENFSIIAIEQSSRSRNLYQLNTDKNTALLVGREVTGFSPAELKQCDQVYEIPMKGMKESFNVSVAAGIALYQARA